MFFIFTSHCLAIRARAICDRHYTFWVTLTVIKFTVMIVNLYIMNVKLIVLRYDTFTCTFLYWIRAVKFLNPMLLSEAIGRIFKTKIKKKYEINGEWNAYHSVSSLFLFFQINLIGVCVCAQSLQLCPTLCDPRDHGPPGSSVHGILQARILGWVAISFSIIGV